MKEIGEKAAEVLLSRLQGENNGEYSIYRLKTEVLIKESVKTINKLIVPPGYSFPGGILCIK